MRKPILSKLEAARDTSIVMSYPSWGAYGMFLIQGPCGEKLKIVASSGDMPEDKSGWEHVSISVKRRLPNWIEMCFVKDLFWDDEECVVQFHPPKSQHVNNHPTCLHLFRPVDGQLRMPPSEMVGIKEAGDRLTPMQARAGFEEFWRKKDEAGS